MKTTVKKFGIVNGIKYDEIIIEEEDKFKISYSDLGARINSWQVPNTEGEWEHIILGFNDAQHLLESDSTPGATIGRVAGRIAHGEFALDGEKYELAKNQGEHHMHGGEEGFDTRKWDYSIQERDKQIDLIFELKGEVGKNGYPGNLKVQVTHTVTSDNEWTISYRAKSDAPTLFNPTNHVYFNLNGNPAKTIENHVIQLKAEEFLPIDEDTLPLGRYEKVEDTAFDLRKGQRFGDLLELDDEQFNIHQGFDHPFVLEENDSYDGKISLPERKRELLFKTEEPTVVVYTLNDAPGYTEIWGENIHKYSGITLEAQKEPDAVNHSRFSSITLEEDELYESRTKYWLKNEN